MTPLVCIYQISKRVLGLAATRYKISKANNYHLMVLSNSWQEHNFTAIAVVTYQVLNARP